MKNPHILILGGTLEARQLANRLVERFGTRLDVTTSLAGQTRRANLPKGFVRRGDFGGTRGLADYLGNVGIDLLVDSTHPFAARISRHAVKAAAATGVGLLALVRPIWDLPADLTVHRIANIKAAPSALAALNVTRVLVTVGHRGLENLRPLNAHLVIRLIEESGIQAALEKTTTIIDRPPYLLADEINLMQQYRIDGVLTKESGGVSTEAKLYAARDLDIPVVMIERPAEIAADRVSHVEDAIKRICQLFSL